VSAWEPVLQALMTERYPRLLARARMLVTDASEAEDLVQEALVASFSRPRGFESLAQAEQYVRRAIVTCFADAARKNGRERDRWERARHGRQSPPDVADAVVASADLAAALRTLSPRTRACVVLRYLDDLSVAQVAHLLSLSEGAVKRYTSDGIAALNARMGTRATLDDRVPVVAVKGGER